MNLTFLCGCTTGEVIARENIASMDTVTFDDEGFLVCAVHHVRRRGWRSLPHVVVTREDGVRTSTSLADYSFCNRDPLDLEAWVIFGEPLPPVPTVLLGKSYEDTRDNRDPQAIGKAILARQNGHDNAPVLRSDWPR